ncbi:MFS transporter [Streptomyces violascens]|uniref:MFS transporter n=1 Tax=Streptomyces violascens TaxID=67381 RepID=UPI00365FAE89
MTFSTGAVVSNLYYIQPVSQTLATSFHVSSGAIGVIITLTQIGYALGLATLVPLGDIIERRKLLMSMLSCAVLGLVLTAVAPSLLVLGAAATVVGLTSVAVQVIVPFAAELAEKGRQGRVVSTVMSGLLLGVLLSRTIAGVVSSFLGWRAVFALGAVITAGAALLLWRMLPKLVPTTSMPYPTLLASVVRLVKEEPVLRIRMVYGALCFASFNAFWASAGFLLAREPYGWSDGQIGAFALLGVAGAMAAKFAGRLADKGLARVATGGFALIMALSYILLGLGGSSLIALMAGVILMDLGAQGVHISNQNLILSLRPEARSRINTAYMTAYFIAASVGAGLSAVLFSAYGWTGVCVFGAATPAAASLLWVGDMLWGARRRGATTHTPAARTGGEPVADPKDTGTESARA